MTYDALRFCVFVPHTAAQQCFTFTVNLLLGKCTRVTFVLRSVVLESAEYWEDLPLV